MTLIEDIDEWFMDRLDEKAGDLSISYRILSAIWYMPCNFIGKWHYRVFVRGKCALKGCDEHYSCGGSLPDDVCEWWCKRCGAEGINHVVYTHELFYPDERLRNFMEALIGR